MRKSFPLLLMVSVLLGCQQSTVPNIPSVYPTKGRIQLDGKPLNYGRVVLHPLLPEAYRAEGLIASDGSFTVASFRDKEGAVPGKYILTIDPSKKSKDYKGVPPTIPPKYQSEETSDLEVTVESTDTDLGTIKLTTPKAGAPGKKK